MGKLYKKYPPFEEIEDPKERKAKGKAYLEVLLERVLGKNQVQSFIKEMVETRWEPLRDVFQPFDDEIESESFCDISGFNLNHLKMNYEKDVQFAVQRFNELQYSEPPTKKDVRAIRSLEIADFIEVIVSILVPTQYVYSFLKRCF